MQNKKSYSLLNKLIVRTSLISLILLVISGIVISLGFRNDITEDIQEGTKDMIIDMILSESFEHVYWVFALCLILLIILIYFTVKNSLKDVNTVSNFVKDIDINKEIRFPNLKTPKEINPLIESLKSSFKKIKDDMKQQREFIDNAAHELNTPIAILRANIEGMDNSKNKKELLNDLELMVNSLGNQLRSNREIGMRVRKKVETTILPIRDSILKLEKILNTELKSFLSKKQYKKWIKYQKKEKKKLLPERPKSARQQQPTNRNRRGGMGRRGSRF